ncbi:MAG TPA: STAS domain-containing protein [Solirubrobacteraceae bacterium]|jgi:anti-sigma B factor antagonist|nr:STAS domain-containing protein [Solirubrobacteraceae bacterium]
MSDDLLGGDVRVLRVAGDVDFDVAPQFKRRISGLIEAGDRQLVVDLSAVEFIDSTAIGVLVGAIRRMRAAGGSLVVVCDNEDVQAIFEAVGLENVIPLHHSHQDAFAALAVTA